MVGSDDPDDRRAFEWGKGSKELVEYYAHLAAVRNSYSALRTGSVEMVDTNDASLMAYYRDEILVVANNASTAKAYAVEDEYIDLVTGEAYEGTVPALRGVILVPVDMAQEITVDTNALRPAWHESYIVGSVHFTDVPDDSWYTDAIHWAAQAGIADGMDDHLFCPELACTRAQVVTFLWRAAGEPVPKTTVNPFIDVTENDYFYNAVLWSAEKGITDGVTEDQFAPNLACTRAQAVTFLWRSEGCPNAVSETHFSDVWPDQYYTTAVAWALANGITDGIGTNFFGVNYICNRAQIVTFLYRNRSNG